MKVLVTGGTGVIGAAAVPALLAKGHDVRLLSRHASRDRAQFPEGVEPFDADVANAASLASALAGCQAVVHIAGIVEEQPPELTFERINVGGTRALCAAAAAQSNPPFIVFVSSLSAERGQSEYQRSKFRAEQVVQRYAGPWLILRPGSVYGPGDSTLSLLLELTRALPAVPVVENGEQPFQPLWHADLGAAIALAVERRDLAGETLELAGPDLTTTNGVLDRLARITGRSPLRLPVPAWLAQMGARAMEAFGGVGWQLREGARLPELLNEGKLQMLLEGNVVRSAAGNALERELRVPLTPLQDGLAMLADALPERLPGEGIGGVDRSIYSAEIVGARTTPAELIERVCEHLQEIMPMDFAAEPGVPTVATDGVTLTGAIPGRGHIQVRMIERTESSVTFATVEGHPLAGVLTFAVAPEAPPLRFSVELVAQAANLLDWVALRTIGGIMQSSNWRAVVRNVVQLSGGTAPGGIRKQSEMLDDAAVAALTERVQHLIDERKRTEATSVSV